MFEASYAKLHEDMGIRIQMQFAIIHVVYRTHLEGDRTDTEGLCQRELKHR